MKIRKKIIEIKVKESAEFLSKTLGKNERYQKSRNRF